ncbi:MAG: hypothetical protein ACR2MP_05110 [Streptosporangiaceae bacterium]
MDKGHGRIERRSIEVTSSLAEYLGSDWPGCAQVFRLTRTRKTGDQVETEVVLGITSLPRERGGAKELLRLTRGHWGIEMALAHCPPSGKLFGRGPHPGHTRIGPTMSSLAWSRYS